MDTGPRRADTLPMCSGPILVTVRPGTGVGEKCERSGPGGGRVSAGPLAPPHSLPACACALGSAQQLQQGGSRGQVWVGFLQMRCIRPALPLPTPPLAEPCRLGS